MSPSRWGEGLPDHYWLLAGKLGTGAGGGAAAVAAGNHRLLVVNIAFGVMTRAAPQLNIFSIGFPLTLVVTVHRLGRRRRSAREFQLLLREALDLLRELARIR